MMIVGAMYLAPRGAAIAIGFRRFKSGRAKPQSYPADRDRMGLTALGSSLFMTERDDLPPLRHAERLTEQRNPRTRAIDRASVGEALAMIQHEDAMAFEATRAVAADVERAIELVVDGFRQGGSLFYVGAGTSGRLGVLDATEQPPTFGASPEMVQGIIAGGKDALVRSIEGAEDRPDDGARDLEEAGAAAPDVVMGIATGGRTPYVLGALRHAREKGMKTIFLSCTEALDGEGELADVQIHALVGPEAITGSTRMKAGTATKLILNQITTISMIQMGKIYENLMVDVQPTNAKLRDRAARILAEVAGISNEAAASKLGAVGYDLKIAIVMALAGSNEARARETLSANDGHVAATIRQLGK